MIAGFLRPVARSRRQLLNVWSGGDALAFLGDAGWLDSDAPASFNASE